MVVIHYLNEEGTTIKNFYNRTRLPVVGDKVTIKTGKGDYNYVVIGRRFVYDWRKGNLKFVEISLKS